METVHRVIFAALIASSLIASGCVPMRSQEYEVTGGAAYDRFDPYGNYGPHHDDNIAIVQLGPSNMPKTGTIIDSESYVITPKGKRVGISTEPYAFDVSDRGPGVPNIRDALYLTNAKGSRDGSSWKDGKWRFFLVVETPQGRETRTFDLKVKSTLDVWWIWQAPN